MLNGTTIGCYSSISRQAVNRAVLSIMPSAWTGQALPSPMHTLNMQTHAHGLHNNMPAANRLLQELHEVTTVVSKRMHKHQSYVKLALCVAANHVHGLPCTCSCMSEAARRGAALSHQLTPPSLRMNRLSGTSLFETYSVFFLQVFSKRIDLRPDCPYAVPPLQSECND